MAQGLLQHCWEALVQQQQHRTSLPQLQQQQLTAAGHPSSRVQGLQQSCRQGCLQRPGTAAASCLRRSKQQVRSSTRRDSQ
mgnify:CR=1 FL=1